MFYSDNILAKKGPLANIWLAAHWDKRLSKAQICQTDINTSLTDIMEGRLPSMALRLSGQILLGVVKIYWRKARYLLDDCSDALMRVKVVGLNGNKLGELDLPKESIIAPMSSITLKEGFSKIDLLLPEPDLNAILNETSNFMNSQDTLQKSFIVPRSMETDIGLAEVNDFEEWNFDLEVPRKQIRMSEDVPEIEKARDAIPMDPFSPERPSLAGTEKTLERDSILPLDDDDQDMMLPFDEDSRRSSAMPALLEPSVSMKEDSILQPIEESISEAKIVKQPAQKKKRKIEADVEIKLSSTAIQNQLKNTSDILVDLNSNAAKKRKAIDALSLMNNPVTDLISEELNGLFSLDNLQEPHFEAPAKKQVEQSNISMAPLDDLPPLEEDNDFIMNDPVPDIQDESAFGIEAPGSPIMPTMSPVVETSSQVTSSNFNTAQFVSILKEKFSTEASVDFEQVLLPLSSVPNAKRRQKASTFFEILVLGTRNYLEVEQEEPFSSIKLTSKPELFNFVV